MSTTNPPTTDTDLMPWLDNFAAKADAQGVAYGLSPQQIADLTARATALRDAYTAHVNAQDMARATRQTKDAAKAAALAAARAAARALQASPAMTDAVRANFGITIADAEPSPAPLPATAPLGIVEPASLRHVLRVIDAANTAGRGKPDGVMGCEVWMAVVPVGAPVPGPEQMRLAGVHTNHQFVRDFASADAGKQACYRLRWRTRRNTTGPWGEPVTATIAA